MYDLIIITGASKGIGFNILNRCKKIAKKIIAISSSDNIFSIKDENIICLKQDLSCYDDIESSLKEHIEYLKPDSLGIILCGAQLGDPGGLLTTKLSNWDYIYKCNVLGNLSVIKTCQDIINFGIKTRIVFFAGGGAAFSNPEFSAYSLTKVSVVRAVENLSIEFEKANKDFSIIALAPGAVSTDMLDKVIKNGGFVRTTTDISEPTNFVYNFLTDTFPSLKLNGKFLHVRDDINSIDFDNKDLFKLRRIQ